MKPRKDMQELGRVITEAREAKGLSARKLEEHCGLNHSFISKLEAVRYETVSADSLMALAQAWTFHLRICSPWPASSCPSRFLHSVRICGPATARSYLKVREPLSMSCSTP